MFLKKMMVKRAIKKKAKHAMSKINSFTHDISREIRKLDRRVSVKVNSK